MGWTERIIDRPRLVIAGVVVMSLLGGAAVCSLPRERTPRVRLPVIVVAVPNPAGQPLTNEHRIVDAIERQASSLDGLRNSGGVLSEAQKDAAIVQFTFTSEIDVEDARRDVESLVNRIKGDFPAAAQADPGPIVSDIAFEDWPVIQVLVAGGSDPQQRRHAAQRLRSQVESLPGVSSVDLFGELEPELRIEADPDLLALHDLSFPQLADMIGRAFADLPSGAIESTRGTEIQVRTEARPTDVNAVHRIPIATRQGSPILLEDVAEIRMEYAPRRNLARYGGQDATVLLVRTRTDADLPGTAEAVQALVDRSVDAGMADGLVVGTGRSIARQIRSMLAQLGASAAWGLATIFVLLLTFLGWRNALIIVSAVPMALLTTAALLWLAKRSIMPDLAVNNMVLFAVILVMGLVVDGCIIVGENIYRHRERGLPALWAAKRGIGEVGWSLITACLTTCAAFAPMIMVGGVVGEFLVLLPIVVVLALTSALVVDHILLPVLSVYFMKVPSRGEGASATSPPDRACLDIDDDGTAGARTTPLRRVYARMLEALLQRRRRVLCGAAVLVLAPIVTVGSGALGLTFFPDSDIPIIEVHFELPLGASLSRAEEVADRIEQAVNRAVHPDEWYRPSPRAARARPVTTIGDPGALNTNLDGQTGTGPEFGMVFVELEFAEHRERSAREIRRAIVRELPDLPGVLVHVRSPSDGPPAGAPVLLRMLAHEHTSFDALTGRAASIEDALRNVPGTTNVTSDHRQRPVLTVETNDELASLFGLDRRDVNAAVSYALDGVRVADMDLGGEEEIDLRLQCPPDRRDSPEDLADLPVRSADGRVVRLGQVATITRTLDTNVIRRYDGRRVITIRAELEDGVSPDDVKSALLARLRPELGPTERWRLLRGDERLLTDSEVTIEFGGENEARDDALKDLHLALAVAAGAMMMILMFHFNSFRQALIILLSVPLSLVGVTIGLMACGLPFSISSMIGVVALSGIVVNDAIVLVDFYNRLRAAGCPPEEAGLRAGLLRLRPILLTTVTTIGGLLPLALNIWGGGEFWQPLAVTIMFGLGVATILQLIVMPVACCAADRRDAVSILDPVAHPELSGVRRAAG